MRFELLQFLKIIFIKIYNQLIFTTKMESLNKAKYAIYKAGTNVAAHMQGTLKDSKFLEKGVLTPEEFVLAGDHLCGKCGTWE